MRYLSIKVERLKDSALIGHTEDGEDEHPRMIVLIDDRFSSE